MMIFRILLALFILMQGTALMALEGQYRGHRLMIMDRSYIQYGAELLEIENLNLTGGQIERLRDLDLKYARDIEQLQVQLRIKRTELKTE